MTALKHVQLDEKKIDEGVWVPYRRDIKFKVASIESAAYIQARVKALKAVPGGGDDQTPEEWREFNSKLFAKVILLDWKNISEEDGSPVPYSEEKAAEILRDRDLDVFEFVLGVAANAGHFERGILEKTAGN